MQQKAAFRLRRSIWAWAALFFALGASGLSLGLFLAGR
jgi:hypothetical protein